MFKTEQESFWAGKFGDEYINRNMDVDLLASNIALFSRIIDSTANVHSFIEFGANIGMNIKALKCIRPKTRFSAIEINERAAKILSEMKDVEVINESILEHQADKKWDFVFTKGVLIHINPDELDKVYQRLYECSNQYIMIAEYYNPAPVSIDYRGQKDKLFKRDFAGDLMEEYKDLTLVDYGFVYHRDNNFKQDDITWFLLEKR